MSQGWGISTSDMVLGWLQDAGYFKDVRELLRQSCTRCLRSLGKVPNPFPKILKKILSPIANISGCRAEIERKTVRSFKQFINVYIDDSVSVNVGVSLSRQRWRLLRTDVELFIN